MKTKTNLFILLILFLSCNLDLNSKSILYQKSSMSFVDDTVAVKIKSKNYSAEQTYTKEDGESFTAAREVNIIKVELNDKLVESKINAAIFKAVTGISFNRILLASKDSTDPRNLTDIFFKWSLQKYVNEVKSLESIEQCYEESVACLFNIGNDHNLNYISVEVREYSMYYGAAHPGFEIEVLNFNLKTGELILLDELFTPVSKVKLKKIVEKTFIKKWGSEDWYFIPGSGNFKLSENFSIKKDGLHFYYNQYEIGCYAMGIPDVTIGWKQLSKINP